jgi:hypothetical protein
VKTGVREALYDFKEDIIKELNERKKHEHIDQE